MEGDTLENRREGGLREGWKSLSHHLFFPIQVDSVEKSRWFSGWLFVEGVYCYIHETRGAGTNLIPCSALTKCTNISLRVDISYTVRSVSAESGSWSVVGYRFDTFNGEAVLLVRVTLANSQVILFFLGQKYKLVFLYWPNTDLSGVLCLSSAAELIAHSVLQTLYEKQPKQDV